MRIKLPSFGTFTTGLMLFVMVFWHVPLHAETIQVVLTGTIRSGQVNVNEVREVQVVHGTATEEVNLRIQLQGTISSTGDPIATVGLTTTRRIPLAGRVTSAYRTEVEQIELTGTISSEVLQTVNRLDLEGVIRSGASTTAQGDADKPIAGTGQPVPEQPADLDDREEVAGEIAELTSGDPAFAAEMARQLLRGFTPTLSTYVRYDSAEARQPGQLVFNNDWTAVVSPSFQLDQESRRWRLSTQYDAEFGRHPGGTQPGFDNHEFQLRGSLLPTRSSSVDLHAAYWNVESQLGGAESSDLQLAYTEAQSYETLRTEVGYNEGRPNDRLRYRIAATAEKYDNGNAARGNLKRLVTSGNLYWQWQRRIGLLLDAAATEYEYGDAITGVERRVYAGTRVLITRRLSGTVQLGYGEQNSSQDYAGSLWKAEVKWNPARHSSLRFAGARDLLDEHDVPSAPLSTRFVVQHYGQVTWEQQWMSNLDTETTLTFRTQESSGGNRWQLTRQLRFAANYRLSEDLSIGGVGVHAYQDAARGIEDNRQSLWISIDWSL